MSNSITISLNKKEKYDQLIKILDELVIYNNIGLSKMTSENYCSEFTDKIKSLREENTLTFKEFITDIKKEEELVDIPYELYEKYIIAKQTINGMMIVQSNYKGDGKGGINVESYRVALAVLIISYRDF
jgi:hypothetical protein